MRHKQTRDGIMADIEPNERPPGFNVVEPGFRAFDEGSVATYGSDLGRPFFSNLKEAAAWVNAAVNGAYSVFPGTYNAGRAVVRGTGLMGADEFRRFGQEADAIGAGLGKLVERPELAVRAAQEAWPILRDNPGLWPYLAGRAVMGGLTYLGPAAMAGDALRAVEKGHNLADAFFYHGILGNPSRDPR
jgi:hypothetical protein